MARSAQETGRLFSCFRKFLCDSCAKLSEKFYKSLKFSGVHTAIMQIVVLNVVGSSPTCHPLKEAPQIHPGALLLCLRPYRRARLCRLSVYENSPKVVR